MPSYFFPCLWLVPKFEEPSVDFGEFAVHRRLWNTSTFDLATLATKHKLHLPYQLIDVYLSHCNVELEFKTAHDFPEAAIYVQMIRALLYLQGVTPFVIPFCTTYSVNQYSGINSRDSDLLREKMPEPTREGLTSKTATVEAWPMDVALLLIRASGTADTTIELWSHVKSQFPYWKTLERESPVVSLVRQIINSAPMIQDFGPSILEIWQGIESLFPTVTSEVSFRLSVLVSQLCAPLRNPGTTYKETKSKYVVRSKIAHGSTSKCGAEDWDGAWSTLCSCLRALIERKKLPSEEELLAELLPS